MTTALTGDLLSAASLALGALAVLYALWAPKIDAALASERARHEADRAPSIRIVRTAIRQMAIPLAVASAVTVFVLMPPTLRVIYNSGRHVITAGLKRSIADYDAIQALFVVVWVMLAALAFLSARQLLALRAKLKDL